MKKLFVTLCIIYTTVSVIWNYELTDGLSKLLFLYTCLALSPILLFYIQTVVLHSVKDHTIKERKEVAQTQKQNIEKQKQEFLREYDTKIKPLYFEGKNLFNKLMKEGRVHNYEIADLKEIIDKKLGKYVDHYHNYKFKNDAHEIYVKMKNFHLNEYDWQEILNFLYALTLNEPVRNKKKTKEVVNK